MGPTTNLSCKAFPTRFTASTPHISPTSMLKTPFPDSPATISDTTFLKFGIGWSITELSTEFGFELGPELEFLLLFPFTWLLEPPEGGLGFDGGTSAEKMEYEASKMAILCSVISRKSRAYLDHVRSAQKKCLSKTSQKPHLESPYSNRYHPAALGNESKKLPLATASDLNVSSKATIGNVSRRTETTRLREESNFPARRRFRKKGSASS